MIDAVLSYHMNPQTCGVAKFNHALAKRLGVPLYGLGADATHPLLSIKPQEMPRGIKFFAPHRNQSNTCQPFDLFLHGPSDAWWLELPCRIYAGNRAIADAVRPYRPDVIEAFCPSTIDGNPTRGAYRVLVFGMAHKLNLPHFEALKQELEIAHPDYTIELSTAVHEGNPWDAALTESVDAMRGIFGDRLRVLGFLGDDALAKELREVDAVACYFTPALRANNTSYWAAVEAGKTIYTNRDEHSPKEGDPPASWDALVALIQGAA